MTASAVTLVAGLYSGQACFASGDLTSLATGDSVLSQATALTVLSGGAYDTFGVFSIQITGLTSNVPAGPIQLYFLPLNQDGSTYGESLWPTSPGTAYVPGVPPIWSFTFNTANSVASLRNVSPLLTLPPCASFKIGLYNNWGFALSGTAADNVVQLSTFNLQH